MSATSEIKFELYIDTTSTGDTANLNPEDTTDVGLNEGITIKENGGGITFDGAGNIKCGKTGYDVGVGWWAGFDEAARKCRVAIGDPANEKVTWDGQDLVIDIDGTNLFVNGGSTGQVLKVASNGTVEFGTHVQNLDDLGDVTGTTFNSSIYKVLIPKSGNVFGFEDLRSVTSVYVRLQDLNNVTNTAPSANGLILRYNSSAQRWEYDTAADVGADISIGNLSDVNITSIADDQVLQYNTATSRFENVSMSSAIANQSLNDHTDVSISGLSNTKPKVLWYQGGTGYNWEAKTNSLGPDVFANITGTLGDGKVLVYNVPGGATDPHWLIKDRTDLLSLNDLQNVSAATPSANQVLQYNGTNWVAATLSAASSATIQDADGDTKVQVEAATDNDEVRLIQNSNQLVTLRDAKVGLGTFSSNPSYLVDIREGSATAQMRLVTLGTNNTIFRNETSGTVGSNFIYFGDSADADVGKIEYNHTDDNMIFSTNAAERMYIDSSGNVGLGETTPDSELHIAGGGNAKILIEQSSARRGNYYGIRQADNLELAADEDNLGANSTIRFRIDGAEVARFHQSGGITFGGATNSAHALDDYEEGTWTPHFADAATGGNHVTAGTQPTGSYTKIGDLVHLSCPAQSINPSGLTSGNVLYIRNFPFTISSSYLQTPSTSVNFASSAAGSMLGAYVFANPGSTYAFIVLPEAPSTGFNENTQTVGAVLRTSTPYTAIRFSITYKAA